MTSTATVSFTIDDGGLLSRLSVAPAIVNYFAAKALGSMFASARKRAILAAPGRGSGGSAKGLRALIVRGMFYTGWPRGGEEQVLLRLKETSAINRIRTSWKATSTVTAIHEFGGTITAKSGKAMMVPVEKLRKARTGRALLNRLTGPNLDTFVLRGRSGTSFLYRKSGTGHPELVALLLKQVNIQPKLGVLRTWNSLEADRTKKVDHAASLIASSLESGRSIDAEANFLLATAFKSTRRNYAKEIASRG